MVKTKSTEVHTVGAGGGKALQSSCITTMAVGFAEEFTLQQKLRIYTREFSCFLLCSK